MSRYEDEDGIDGPFERAMEAAMREDAVNIPTTPIARALRAVVRGDTAEFNAARAAAERYDWPEIDFIGRWGHSSTCNCMRRYKGRMIVSARRCNCRPASEPAGLPQGEG